LGTTQERNNAKENFRRKVIVMDDFWDSGYDDEKDICQGQDKL
jgi:hypothetical protein